MLFTGEYEHTIDAKQRLAIPSVIRSRLDPKVHGSALYVVPGPNGALWVWPERIFEQMAGAMERTLLPAEEMMEYDELMFSQAACVELDSAGRIRLPDRLLRFAGIRQAVVVLGVKDHLELRDPEDWKARREEKLAKHGEIMLRARAALLEQQQRPRPEGR